MIHTFGFLNLYFSNDVNGCISSLFRTAELIPWVWVSRELRTTISCYCAHSQLWDMQTFPPSSPVLAVPFSTSARMFSTPCSPLPVTLHH